MIATSPRGVVFMFMYSGGISHFSPELLRNTTLTSPSLAPKTNVLRGCHDEVENASIRSPSLRPVHPIRQPGNGGGQRQSLRGVVEPHVTAAAGSTPR